MNTSSFENTKLWSYDSALVMIGRNSSTMDVDFHLSTIGGVSLSDDDSLEADDGAANDALVNTDGALSGLGGNIRIVSSNQVGQQQGKTSSSALSNDTLLSRDTTSLQPNNSSSWPQKRRGC